MNLRALVSILVLLGGQPAWADSAIRGTPVVRDCDSLEIGSTRIRLWGVDAPEFQQQCRRGAQRWKCGEAARDALRRRVAQRVLECEPVERDKHGRVVARCATEGRSLNEWLVRAGWAIDYPRYSKGRYAQAQAFARSARRGIWIGEFEAPEVYRRMHPRP